MEPPHQFHVHMVRQLAPFHPLKILVEALVDMHRDAREKLKAAPDTLWGWSQ
jgi:hypothetical protein